MTSSPTPPVDAHGKSLLDYPRPSVAVDTALLSVHQGQLCVALVRTRDGVALPGTFVHPGERLADAVLRSLREKAAVTGRSPEQLHVFDDPVRDERGWVLSVAHVDVVPHAVLAEALQETFDAGPRVSLVNVTQVPPLPYDHADIIGHAIARVRGDYAKSPDPWRLLEEPFTLKELRELHEAVMGERLQRDTFRRAMDSQLEATGYMTDGTKGRPAALFGVL